MAYPEEFVSPAFWNAESSTKTFSTSPTSSIDETKDDDDPRKYGMTGDEFRQYAKHSIDYITNYIENIEERRVFPDVQPGYLEKLLPHRAPKNPEKYENVINDFDKLIMPGVTHWKHPKFHAYYPAGNSYPSLIASILGDGIGALGFTWASCPAITELEIVMLEWLGTMIGLPKSFLPLTKDGKGGGAIQSSASDCTHSAIIAGRFQTLKKLREQLPFVDEHALVSKFVGYCSREAHSSVSKGYKVAMIKCRELDTDSNFGVRGETLRKAIEEDLKNGMIPMFMVATLGTTSFCSFDNLAEIGPICEEFGMWLHVDAAYAGSAMICPEHRKHLNGVEFASSFATNPHKWMLLHYDCSTMWLQDKKNFVGAFVIDPIYMKHDWNNKVIDYRHWGIPLSRRFRALKLWFVIRMYGVKGIQKYIRNHCKLAKYFEHLFKTNGIYEIVNQVVMGLVVFRIKADNSVNQKLLKTLNDSGKIYLVTNDARLLFFFSVFAPFFLVCQVPALCKNQFCLRICITTEVIDKKIVKETFDFINETAHKILDEAGKTVKNVEQPMEESIRKEGEETILSLHKCVEKQKANEKLLEKFGYLGVMNRDEAEHSIPNGKRFGFYHEIGADFPIQKNTPKNCNLAAIYQSIDGEKTHFKIEYFLTKDLQLCYFIDFRKSKKPLTFSKITELMKYYNRY